MALADLLLSLNFHREDPIATTALALRGTPVEWQWIRPQAGAPSRVHRLCFLLGPPETMQKFVRDLLYGHWGGAYSGAVMLECCRLVLEGPPADDAEGYADLQIYRLLHDRHPLSTGSHKYDDVFQLPLYARRGIVLPCRRCYMPRRSPYDIHLTSEEQCQLRHRADSYTSPYCDVVRAKLVLLAAEGLPNDEIGRRLDLPRQVVSKWRKRFFYERLEGLADRPRRGRPGGFPPSGRRRG